MAARSVSPASVTQEPKLYGMTSGGTRPATRVMTKNGAPSGAGSGSYQCTAGTGTRECSATARMTRAWPSRSYVGKTGTAVSAGATRATSGRSVPSQRASNSSVSLDMPVVSGMCTFSTIGSVTFVASHDRRFSRTCSGSRRESLGRATSASWPAAPDVDAAGSMLTRSPSGHRDCDLEH